MLSQKSALHYRFWVYYKDGVRVLQGIIGNVVCIGSDESDPYRCRGAIHGTCLFLKSLINQTATNVVPFMAQGLLLEGLMNQTATDIALPVLWKTLKHYLIKDSSLIEIITYSCLFRQE